MGQRIDLLNAEPDELVDGLIGKIRCVLASDLDRQFLAGILLEGAIQAIGQIVPDEAQKATRQAFIGLAVARLGSNITRRTVD
ncbi:MAG: hypothetical protein ABSC95_07625 [Acetobacteraceae bacterium]|jgi:hypothetical protein